MVTLSVALNKFMESIQMLIRRISRIIFDKRAVSNVISAVILTGVVVALSFAVFGWAQSRSLEKRSEIAETVDAETARLKEKLVFEYVFYGNPSGDITVYLLNCGTIDDVEIKNVYVGNSTWLSNPPFSTLKFLNGAEIPDQDLDVGEEGYLELSTSLSSGYYNVRVVTVRGATFDQDFVV